MASTAVQSIFKVPANSDLRVSSLVSDLTMTPLSRSPFFNETWSAKAIVLRARARKSELDLDTYKYYGSSVGIADETALMIPAGSCRFARITWIFWCPDGRQRWNI